MIADADKGLNQSVLDHMMQLTAANEHTEALIQLAYSLTDVRNFERLKGIKRIHDADGSLDPRLAQMRREIRTALMQAVRERYGDDKAGRVRKTL